MSNDKSNTVNDNELPVLPDANGHFGIYGGRFVSETLSAALDELEAL
jgi:tryptophan synthase beta chain